MWINKKKTDRKTVCLISEKRSHFVFKIFFKFAYSCCKKYKQTNASISLVFVTPYIKVDPIICQNYDSILYPGLEDKMPRYAITYRNRFMVDKADLIIAYIDHEWGGAYNTYKYAKKKGKRIINLAEMQ